MIIKSEIYYFVVLSFIYLFTFLMWVNLILKDIFYSLLGLKNFSSSN